MNRSRRAVFSLFINFRISILLKPVRDKIPKQTFSAKLLDDLTGQRYFDDDVDRRWFADLRLSSFAEGRDLRRTYCSCRSRIRNLM
ncbi:unnamed protein product [Rhodiola kirilowii]